MKKAEMFPSDYIKSEDVSGEGTPFKILEVITEEFNDIETSLKEKKPVVRFHGEKKKLILNKTNWERLEKLFGPESDDWANKKITLRLEAVSAFGKTVDAVRVKV